MRRIATASHWKRYRAAQEELAISISHAAHSTGSACVPRKDHSTFNESDLTGTLHIGRFGRTRRPITTASAQ